MSVVFFGKLPTAADFVRRGVTSAPMRGFENWFHEAYEELRGAGEKGLRYPCSVVYAGPERSVIAAIALPSRDKIGREFPAVAATSVGTEQLRGTSASWLLGFVRFWEDTMKAVQSNANAEAGVVCDAVQSVAPPSDVELSTARERWTELLANLGARQMESDCFENADDRYYAYRTLLLATRDAPGGDPRVLACPGVGKIAYRAFWVETAHRATPADTPLTTLWLSGPDAPGDILVSLGSAPRGMLRFAMGHGAGSKVLWPLKTTHEAARARAKEALAGGIWDDADQKLGGLIETILSTQK